jgi:adenylate cyclase
MADAADQQWHDIDVDEGGWVGDALTAADQSCNSCGTQLGATAKFCSECGAPVRGATASAEYKQVTVLFADVVHSMDIAAVVGAERLREIMGSVFDLCASVVQRRGGTVDKFTGDGIMALFGAPTALEDHAFRACLAALDIHHEVAEFASDIQGRDGVELRLRVGLNSGQVITGEIGSDRPSYTAVGEQVGMAQRMESVAPPGGVMLSESTARLVQARTILGAPELLHIKGSAEPVPAQRLLRINTGALQWRSATTLIGRSWELGTIGSLIDEVTDGAGAVITIAGPPGIGKTRLVREATATAGERGMAVFSTYCESHSGDIAFRVVTRLLRATTGVNDLDAASARDSVRAQVPEADPQDVLLLDDLLGIADSGLPIVEIAPDARRRRLTALINTASLARTAPTMYVIEDVHWIDQASEALITDFLTVIPQTPSLVLITYRPEYRGPLSRVVDAQSMRLRPLSTSHAAALTTELLGADPSVAGLGAVISERAAGNPFFVEEIVRDLAEQGVLDGPPGDRRQRHALSEVQVPATLQAAIAARIDRLDADAKRTLNAASVIGSRFDSALLTVLAPDPVVDELIAAQLIDQTRYTPHAEYAFHHPLIQAVAYTTQLRSTRAQLHRRLADAIEHSDENAAFIAEHLESANDFADAHGWHMRAGAWSLSRDITAAHTSWARARQLADNLPADCPDRADMRIAPRVLISATAWRAGGSGAESGFEELRDLCVATGDQRSLAMGMAGQIISLEVKNRRREASELGAELTGILERIGDPALTVAAGVSAVVAKFWTAEMTELLRVAELVIDASGGDVTIGNLVVESPVLVVYALRGTARWCLGIPGWRDDLQTSVTLSHQADPATRAVVTVYAYLAAVSNGVLVADAAVLRETADTLDVLEQDGDNFSLNEVRTARAVVLARQDGPERSEAFELFAKLRDEVLDERLAWLIPPIIDTHIAEEQARTGDLDGAMALARSALDDLHGGGGSIFCLPAATVLVQSLLARNSDGDLEETQAAIDRLATASPTDPDMALIQVTSLRLKALIAQARSDEEAYRELRDRYRKTVSDLGFEGHIAWADAMQ